MEFGYFTLSDNHYANNSRNANEFVANIVAEAVYAEEIGLHSAWIGEHHFSTLGVLSCPDLVLANVAARTKRIRLAPAVTVLPLHHPIRVAEQWATLDLLSGGRVDFAAGRGYDRREYLPFKVSFEDNQAIFEEGLEVVRRLWASDGPISHRGNYYQFDNVGITPKPIQRPLPAYVASFSKPSMDLAGKLGCGLVVAPFARGLGADVLLGTELAFDADDRATGAFATPNCRGREKIVRLKAAFGPGVRIRAAYGDTRGDREMLALAEEQGMKVFNGTGVKVPR